MKAKFALGFAITAILFFLIPSGNAEAQKVGFISSDVIRQNFPEAQQADQRIRSFVEEWKRELASIKKDIGDLEEKIQKNRLVWSDEERRQKEQELESLRRQQETYAKNKFEVNGEYDVLVKEMMQKVEEKIYAAVQEVASNEGYDIVLDKSVEPLVYNNFKYDLTVKVLKKLNVDVDKLEKELEEKIAKDPRNAEKQSKTPPRRGRTRQKDDPREIEKETPVPDEQGNVPQKEIKPKVNPEPDPTMDEPIEDINKKPIPPINKEPEPLPDPEKK